MTDLERNLAESQVDSSGDIFKEMLEVTAKAAMEAGVPQHLGAGRHEPVGEHGVVRGMLKLVWASAAAFGRSSQP